jgi:hypothetical protein
MELDRDNSERISELVALDAVSITAVQCSVRSIVQCNAVQCGVHSAV